jgi:hypothetical protein
MTTQSYHTSEAACAPAPEKRRPILIIDKDVVAVHASQIGPYAFATYCAIAWHANNGKCKVSHQRLSDLTGIGRRTIIQTVETLEQHGLIQVTHKGGGKGIGACNEYLIVQLPLSGPSAFNAHDNSDRVQQMHTIDSSSAADAHDESCDRVQEMHTTGGSSALNAHDTTYRVQQMHTIDGSGAADAHDSPLPSAFHVGSSASDVAPSAADAHERVSNKHTNDAPGSDAGYIHTPPTYTKLGDTTATTTPELHSIVEDSLGGEDITVGDEGSVEPEDSTAGEGHTTAPAPQPSPSITDIVRAPKEVGDISATKPSLYDIAARLAKMNRNPDMLAASIVTHWLQHRDVVGFEPTDQRYQASTIGDVKNHKSLWYELGEMVVGAGHTLDEGLVLWLDRQPYITIDELRKAERPAARLAARLKDVMDQVRREVTYYVNPQKRSGFDPEVIKAQEAAQKDLRRRMNIEKEAIAKLNKRYAVELDPYASNDIANEIEACNQRLDEIENELAKQEGRDPLTRKERETKEAEDLKAGLDLNQERARRLGMLPLSADSPRGLALTATEGGSVEMQPVAKG